MSGLVGNPFLLTSAGAAGYQISRSLRFNSADSAYLSRTPASAGNRKTWTWSGWVKRSALGGTQVFFGSWTDSSNTMGLMFNTSNQLFWDSYSSGSLQGSQTTSAVFRDTSAWYHIVWVVDTTDATAANRSRIYVNGTEVAYAGATNPSQNADLIVNRAASHTIGNTSASAGNYFSGYLANVEFVDGSALTPSSFAETNATTGQWMPKAYTGSYGTNGFRLDFSDNSAATATTLGKDYSGNNNNWTPNNFAVGSNPVYSNGLTTNGSKTGWFGGTPAQAFDSSTTTFVQGALGGDVTFTPATAIPVATQLRIWADSGSGSGVGSSGYQIIYNGTTIYNQSAMWTSPYTISAAPGTSLSSLVIDTSAGGEAMRLFAVEVDGVILVDGAGAGNDSLVDTPTSYGTDTGAGGDVRGNYATLNPLVNFNSSTLSNGNLDITCASLTGQWRTQKGGWGFYGGKFYFEATLNAGGSAGNSGIGIGHITLPHSGNTYPGQSVGSYAYTSDGGKIDSGSASYPWSTWTVSDVIGVAADLTAGTVAFYKNGTLQGSMTGLDTTLTYEALVGSASSTASQYSLNFGQRPFAFPVSGFKALCDTNLPAPVVAKPNTAFDAVPYTGSSGSQNITTNFSPDLVWVKTRNATTDHELYDTVRGAGIRLSSNATLAESNLGANGLTSFNSNGFTVPSTANYGINGSGYTYAAWAWDAGSSTVTNTSGSISSQVRANASAGFSVCTFTTQSSGTGTFGHGLNVAPSLVITKARAVANNWITYHASVGNTGALLLNSTAATDTQSFYWNNTTPTATVVTLGSGFAGSNSLVAYCFAPVAGYSAFGSYTGNGSADGPFVYTGFRPRFVLIKRTDASVQWVMYDSARDSYNVSKTPLAPNESTAESGFLSGYEIDILSNGFKIRNGPTAVTNASGSPFVYAAFAENPFQYARAR